MVEAALPFCGGGFSASNGASLEEDMTFASALPRSSYEDGQHTTSLAARRSRSALSSSTQLSNSLERSRSHELDDVAARFEGVTYYEYRRLFVKIRLQNVLYPTVASHLQNEAR